MSVATQAISHRSYSQINSVRNCGESYRLERIERVPQRPSCAAVGGVVVHTATELVDMMIHQGFGAHRDALSSDANEAAVTAMDREIDKRTGDYPVEAWKQYGRQDIVWFREVGIPQSIDAYINWRLATGLELAVLPDFGPAIEVPFSFYLGQQQVKGFIDRVFQTASGEFLLVDLKSGTKPKTDEQLGTYRKALYAGAGLDVTWGAYLYGLKSGEAKLTPAIDLTHWTDEKLERLYVEGNRLISLGIFIPHPGDQCIHCSVSSHCQFVQSVV